jgi:hypothetical protein
MSERAETGMREDTAERKKKKNSVPAADADAEFVQMSRS